MSGRKKDAVWQYFDPINKDLKNKKARCKKCGKVLQAMVSRMKLHRSKCQQMETLDLELEIDSDDDISLETLRKNIKAANIPKTVAHTDRPEEETENAHSGMLFLTCN